MSIGSWYGNSIESLDRDGLLKIIEFLSKQLEMQRKEHEHDLDFICNLHKATNKFKEY